MTKQKPSDLSDSEQSERFLRAAQDLIDAGELDPTEADAVVDRVLKRQARSVASEPNENRPPPSRNVGPKKPR